MATDHAFTPNDAKALAGARVLLALLFLVSGAIKVATFRATVEYAASKGLPLPMLGIGGAALIEVGCGLMLLTGFRVAFAAIVLAIFVVPTTLIFHPFWSAGTAQFSEQLYNFLKNVAIDGGLIYVAVVDCSSKRATVHPA